MPIKLNGATSGSVELDVPAAVGSDLQLTLPATAGDVVVKAADGSVDLGSVDIDSSGRLLVGTSTARSNIYVGNTVSTPAAQINTATNTYDNGLALINYTAGGYATWLTVGSSNSDTLGTNTATPASYQISGLNFVGNDGTNFRSAALIAAENDQASAWAAGDCPGKLVFFTTADGASSPTKRMVINSSGKVVVSSTTYTNHNSAQFLAVGNGIHTPMSTFVPLTVSYDHIVFRNPNGNVGSITTSGSATSYNTSSDYRLKENVVDIADGIIRVKQLSPRRFNFIADADATVDGFLAHEAQTVVPEAVTGTKDATKEEEYEVTPAVLNDDGEQVTPAVMGTRTVPDHQGIDQSKLVPLLTAALQEAIAKIETLETKVAALEVHHE